MVGKWNPGEQRDGINVDASDKKLIWNLPFILEDAERFDDLFYNKKKQYEVSAKNYGNYTKDDFEAMAYWYKHPIQNGDTVSLCGKKKKIQAYLNQALLMHVFLENPPTYHIYSDDFCMEDFWAGKKGQSKNQIKAVNEKIIVSPRSECKNKKKVICVDELLKRAEVTEYAIKELCYETIERAKMINSAYSGDYSRKENDWIKLSSFTKGSNICSAAFVKMHRENYANKMEMRKMAEIEHIRWCRYHLIHGWKYGDPLDADKNPIAFSEIAYAEAAKNPRNWDENGKSLVETKDVNAKWHTCLVSYDELSMVEKIKPGILKNDEKAVMIGITTIVSTSKKEEGSSKVNE